MLLQWRYEQYDPQDMTAETLADSLSWENLRLEDGLPFRIYQALKEFRKLRLDARVAACKAFLQL